MTGWSKPIDETSYSAHEIGRTHNCHFPLCTKQASRWGVCDHHAREIVRVARRRRDDYYRALKRLEARREVAMPARSAGVKELVKEVQAAGFKVVSGGKHMRVLDAKGRVVVDANGPVIISGTPSDVNWRDAAEARLRGAGVLKEKKGPTKRKDERPEQQEEKLTSAERERAQRLARQTAVKDGSRERHERTMKLRARAEPLVTKVGGWNSNRGPASSGVQLTELGMIAELWSQRQGDPEMFSSTEAASKSAKILREGGTLSDDRAKLWEALVADWEASENARAWYFERLREAKGLKPDWRVGMNIAPTTLPEPIEEPPVGEALVPLSPPPAAAGVKGEAAGSDGIPFEPALLPEFTRAMRAVYLMSRGATGEDWEEILEFATLIASYGARKENVT